MTVVLQTTNLQKRFGGLLVTDNVSLTLRAGARHALIGPNGAGKTTLVSLLSGALQPDSGYITLGGRDITRESRQYRVKHGLVRTFQVNNLFPGLTTLENIVLALSERNRVSTSMFSVMARHSDLIAEANTILASVGLTAYAGRRIAELPYGPQRLVEIAIALSLEPKVLLLDEPAAGIPAADASLLLDTIGRLPADIAILMIEHDMHVVRRFATEVTVLVAGSVLLSGRPEEIMTSPEVHRVYLGKDRHAVPAKGGGVGA